jgi:hypothetical protein
MSLSESSRDGMELSRKRIAVEDLIVANQRLASCDSTLEFEQEVETSIGGVVAQGVRLIHGVDEVKYRDLYTLPDRELLVILVYNIQAQEKSRTLLGNIKFVDHP